MELSDKECVARCLRGDVESFRPLVERYQRLVFSHTAGRLRDPVHTEEAVQEAFVRAFENLKKLRKPESFYAWLLSISARVAQEHFRTLQRHTQEDQTLENLVDENAHREEQPSLEAALAALPEHCRRMVQLRYYEELSCQEVALRLDIPLGTVTKTLSRAYALLRQELSNPKNIQLATQPITLRSGHEMR
jgi:RNA polymerase sigma-70 factor (ECF subfamily)